MTYSLSKKFIIWIDDNTQLESIVSRWKRQDWLCVDTEFIRCSTFYPKPALIQVFDGKNIALIDPLRITCWNSFATILTDPAVLKIMHAPQEDMCVLKILTGQILQSMMDTQLAAAFCNLPYPCGYQTLVKKLLDVDVSKESTRSDWLKRPLTDEQIMYASSDVYYLPKLYKVLYEKIKQDSPKKLQWLKEECNLIAQKNEQENNLNNLWQEIKLSQNLPSEQQKTLKILYTWRELYIRKHNIPRKRMLSTELLINIARCQPTQVQHLQYVPGLSAQLIRKYGKQIIKEAELAQKLPEQDNNEKLAVYLKPPPEIKPASHDIQKACKQICQQFNMNSVLLPGKKYASHIIQQWLATGKFSPPKIVTQTWRKALLQPVIDMLTHKYGHIKNTACQNSTEHCEE